MLPSIQHSSPSQQCKMNKVSIINPATHDRWDNLLLEHEKYSFFHTSHWAQVLQESYNYKPIYLSIFEGNRIAALLPMMEINSILTGKRGVSLPFSDECEPLFHNEAAFGEISNYGLEYGRSSGWKTIEIRGGQMQNHERPVHKTFVGHTLQLAENEEQVFKSFRSSTKRNIKKAAKQGVCVNISHSLESLTAFYRLNCVTRREHGLPPQPFNFFKKIFEHIINKQQGLVVTATYQAKIIAASVYFHIGKKALYKYGASLKSFQHLRANNLVMWEAIKWFCHNGFDSFTFGRTAPGNKGLLQFKSGWGAEEEHLQYFKYDLSTESYVGNDSDNSPAHYPIIKYLPIPVLRLMGNILYKHVG